MAPTLNPDEVNALMSAIQDGRITPEPETSVRGKVVTYDLTSQDRVIRGQMPTLDAINEQVASTFGVGLAGRTRLPLRVTSSPATLLKFLDFNPMLAPPATVCVLSLGKGSGHAIVVLEPGLGDALMAAALGDRKARPEEASSSDVRRELTSLEKQVLRRLLSLLTDAMTAAWAPVLAFRPEVLRFESDPRLVAIAPPNDPAILCTFEVSGAFSGRMQLAMPFTAVEPAKKLLTQPPRMHALGDERFAANMASELEQVHVELRATLGRTTVRVSRLLEMEAGDILTLDTSEGAPLDVLVEGRPKLSGHPRVIGGAMAIVVDRSIASYPVKTARTAEEPAAFIPPVAS